MRSAVAVCIGGTALSAANAKPASGPSVPAGAAGPSAGAAGLGDRLNPGIGNGGYDVQSYDLYLRYATADPAQAIDGDETIVARATQSLSQFNLDYGGKDIGTVRQPPLREVMLGRGLP